MINISFDNDLMLLSIDNKTHKINIKEVSEKLAKANNNERSDFRFSPSMYGIHWNQLDEDLSINGLLKHTQK